MINIVLITFELIINNRFKIFINYLYIAQRLNRIYINKYYTILNNQEIFRKKMRQLNHLIEIKI